MDATEMEEDGSMTSHDNRLNDMEQVDIVSGRNSPSKQHEGMEVGGNEDLLAKFRQQVNAASLLAHQNNARSPDDSPPRYFNHMQNNNVLPNHGHIFEQLNSLLQSKLKQEDDPADIDEESRELLLRARDSLLASPHSLLSAMRNGGPPSLVPPPTSHIPYMPPSSQMPPTPGSAGSSSSGNGNRTPSHTPELNHNQQPWSFEEQFKQARHDDYGLSDSADSPRVREPSKHSSFEDDKRKVGTYTENASKLYELSSDPKRKDFLDELFAFMQKRASPINRLPIMAKQVLDLYELYNLVVERGGLVDVINKKLWQEIIKGLKLPSSITSAAFTLRTQYMKYLYPFECEKRGFSNPSELQCAIDGNRREGRRSSYGTYGDMMQPPMLPLQNLQNFQNFQNLQNPLGIRPPMNGNNGSHPLLPQDLLLGRGGSPPGSQEALLEATRLTMWKLYNQGLQNGMNSDQLEEPPKIMPSHMPVGLGPIPSQKEALNLEAKEDNDPWMPRTHSRSKDNGEMRHPKEEHRPPSAKRLAGLEESEDMRNISVSNGSTSLSIPGANIKITSRGDGRGNDQSLVVSMEINGMLYQGVLFAQSGRATRFS